MLIHSAIIAAARLIDLSHETARDSFTGSSGTALTSHTPEVGGGWTKHASFASGSIILSAANRARNGISGDSLFYVSTAPDSADYIVSADVFAASASGDVGLLARMQAGAATYYLLDVGHLYTVVNGSIVNTQTWTTSLFTSTKVHRLSLEVRGNVITGYLDGTQVATVTNASISSAGFGGFYLFGASSNSTAYHVDNFKIEVIPTWGSSQSIQVGQLWNNSHDNVATPRQSPLSFVRFTTRTGAIKVGLTTDISVATPSGFASIGVTVDGVQAPSIVARSDGQLSAYFDLGAPTLKTIEITAGPQNKPSSTILGTYIDSITLPANATMNVLSPDASNRILVYGDSISCGYADNDYRGMKGWTKLLRAAGYNVMVEAYGFRALKDDAIDGTAATAFAALLAGYNPSKIWLAVGTNDYGQNRWSAANFGTAYAALLDAIHSALPTTPIFAQTPIVATSEVANSFGNTLGDYRTQISTAVGSRAWSTLVDGTTLVSSGNISSDGVHPTSAGHVTYEASVVTALGPP